MILTSLAFLALWGWIYLAFWRADFWRAESRLDDRPPPPFWPDVAAVIPARDEAASIGEVIRAHLESDYPGGFSVIVVDDASTDGTADEARRAATAASRPVEVIEAPPLEPGWTGKLAAQRAGVARAGEAAQGAQGARYLLLCDADIVLAPATLRRLVAKAEGEGLALASLMARLDARGASAGLLIPAFVYFFQKLYPFPSANDPKSRVAAAAGGCMLVRKDALEAAGGLASIRTRLIDDCALAEAVKLRGAGAPRPIWIGLAADEARSLRDNCALSSIWSMVARSAFAQLNHSYALAAAAVAGMGVLYLLPPLVVLFAPVHETWAAAGAGAAAWAMMSATFVPTLRLYGEPAWKAALLPVAAGLYAAMTLHSAVQHARGQGGRWKGRVYGSEIRL